jgi:hypothetical protein
MNISTFFVIQSELEININFELVSLLTGKLISKSMNSDP